MATTAANRHRRLSAAYAGLLFAALLTGCHGAQVRVSRPPAPDCQEHQVVPQAIEPDVQPLSASHVDPAVVLATAVDTPLSQLFEVDCQCHAARMAPIADLLEQEYRLASALAACQKGDAACALALQCRLLRLRVIEHRNKAAADALVSFYRLADVEGRAAKLNQSITLLDETIDRADRLQERGLLQNVDRSALRRKRLELATQEEALALARTQLNADLRVRLGCDPTTALAPYWPELSWAVKPMPVDEDAAVAVALAQRPDLRSLNLMREELNTATLPVARSMLATVDAALGTAQARSDWLGDLKCPDGSCDEAAVRQAQLARLASSTQLSVTAEARSAVARIESATEEVLLAEQTAESWQDRVSDLRRTRDVANGSIFEVNEAEGELLAAEARLIEKITVLRLARLELRRVQGVLAAECGMDVLAAVTQ
jgi:hypothetical protein